MKIRELPEAKQVQLIDNLWMEGKTMWDLVSTDLEKNKKYWQNVPAWLDSIPKKRSKARDNRMFRAMEKLISTLCARPSKPNVVNILSDKDAVQLSSDLQKTFLQKYTDIGIKNKIRRALRYLFLSRFFCLKVVWDVEMNDFDVIVVSSKNVRVSQKATSMYDTKYVIEKVEDILATDVIAKFSDKRFEVIAALGYGTPADEKAANDIEAKLMVEGIKTEYYEVWMDGDVIYKLKEKIIGVEQHPYWDWSGMHLTTQEMIKVKEGNKGVLKKAEKNQVERFNISKNEETGEETRTPKDNLHQYLYNYFERPIPPYIFGTMLAVDTRPVGETSLLDQVLPLQEEIDKRKRQISDNTEMMNGQYKIDTKYVKITKAEAQAAKSDPRGIWFGPGVSKGVEIMTGKEMPATVFNEMNHSIMEVDNLMGSLQSLSPEQLKGITAAARAIDREESYQTLDELIDLVDNTYLQIYSWMYQMMKIRYTETHYIKISGLEVAQRIIQVNRSSFNEGIEIKIIPGQILPEDRFYRAERATEEIKAGIIDPETYFKDTERDNAGELAKHVEMYKISPFLTLNFTDEEMQKITPIMQMMRTRLDTREVINFKDLPEDAKVQVLAKLGIQSTGGGGEEASAPADKAQEVAAFRKKAKELVDSPEFQKLPPDQQKKKLEEIKQQLAQLLQGHADSGNAGGSSQ